MPNDKDTLDETIQRVIQNGAATVPELFDVIRYLLQQNEQQKAELEKRDKFIDEIKQDTLDLHKLYQEECAKLQQSREENERLTREIKSHGPEGRNYTNAQYVELLLENERLRGELERYEERRQTAALEVGKLVIEHDQLKAERDDYRKVLEWYGDGSEDGGEKARDIIARYPEKGE